jgi:hypothetical protein
MYKNLKKGLRQEYKGFFFMFCNEVTLQLAFIIPRGKVNIFKTQ